jgi:hypothetical protein
MFYCPEGAEEFSPGFQPWEPSSNRFALKGQEIAWASPTLIAPLKGSDKPLLAKLQTLGREENINQCFGK